MQIQPSLPPWFWEQETPPWPCSPCSFSFLPSSGQGGRWKFEEESTQKQKENKFLNRILNAGGELFSPNALWIIINMLIYGGIKNTSEYIGLVRSSWSAEDVSELSSLLLASLITWCLAAVWFLSWYAPLLTDLFLAPVRVCFLCNLPVCRSWGLWPIWVNTAGGAPPAQFGVCNPWFLAVAAGGAGFAGSDAKLCKKLTSHCCSCHILVKLQHAFRCHETKKQVAGKGWGKILLFLVRAGGF